MSGNPTAVDLFSGAGGFTVGLKEAGFDVLWANDNDGNCEKTYRENHPDVEFDGRDIREIDPADLNLPADSLDLIVGGPPCPTFSVVGRSKINSIDTSSVLSDDRHHLYEEFISFVEYFEPNAFLMENVPGMRSTTTESGENVVRQIKRQLREAGFRVADRLVDAADYGVPQRRERLFLIGNRRESDILALDEWATHRKPTPQERGQFSRSVPAAQTRLWDHFESIDTSFRALDPETKTRYPWVTVADALLDLPPVSPEGEMPPNKVTEYKIPALTEYQRWARDIPEGKEWSEVALQNHECRDHNLYDLSLYKLLGEGVGWSSQDIDDELHPYRSDVFEDQYTKQDPQKPASTVTAHVEKDGHMSIHPREARSFTVREVARLQSFKDTYNFPVVRGQAYRQIGNAVPPLLAEALVTAIRDGVLAPAE